MLGLIVRAVRSRAAQAVSLLVLTALAAAVAAAGPWYAAAAAQRAAATATAAAPAAQRVVSVRQRTAVDGDPRSWLTGFAGVVRDGLPVPDPEPVLGLAATTSVAQGGVEAPLTVGFRDGFCGHVRLTGRCPANRADVAVSENTARRLGVDVGDAVVVRVRSQAPPVRLRVVARYRLLDPAGAFWTNTLFFGTGDLDPVFTPVDTFRDAQLRDVTATYDADVPGDLLRGDGTDALHSGLQVAADRFADRRMELINPTGPLLEAVRADRAAVRLGVLVASVHVLVLAWFAIGLAGRSTARDRRGDAALLTLRGGTRRRVLTLMLGQHVVPLTAGVLLGAPAGWLIAWAVAGPVAAADERRAAFLWCAGAAAAVFFGALLVLAAVEYVVVRQPVAALLRRVPARRRDWRADVVDVGLLAVVAAAAYQARAGAPDDGLALLAPALVALAVALLVARLAGRLADRIGGAALRAGRLRFGLAAVQLSRPGGTDRVLALVVVAVAVFTAAAGGWSAGRSATHDRSVTELGASRVLTVQAANRTHLLSAVRRADPSGRYAMAAVVDPAATPPVLAVDSSRLAAVAAWRPEYGPVGALAAAGPAPAPAPLFTGAGLELRAANERTAPVSLTVVLQHEATGEIVPVTLGPLPTGTHTVSAPVRGCTPAPGCRLVRWELIRAPGADGRTRPPAGDARVTLLGLSRPDRPGAVLGSDGLGDIGRWRADSGGPAATLAAGGGRLTLAVTPNRSARGAPGNRVYPVDAVLPVPLVLAGPPPADWRSGESALSSLGDTPVRVAGAARALPGLGDRGALVDLDTARRVGGEAALGGTDQVWLAAGAPPGVVAALTAAGLTVVGEDSVAARTGRLRAQGTALAARFALFGGVVALLLAAAVVAVVAAVDRGGQLDQFRALRVQGLPRRSAVTAAGTGLGGLLVVALAAGLLAAVVARPVAGVPPPVFSDGWQGLPPPGPLPAAAVAAAGAAALLVLAATWAVAVLPLVRRLREDRS